jgi:hypothetical protein
MAIIDAHMHLMTSGMFRRTFDRVSATLREAARDRARVRGATFQERIAQ